MIALPSERQGLVIFLRLLAPDLWFLLSQTNTVFVASFATRARARILSDCNVFCTLRAGRKMVGSSALGAFLV